MKPDEIVEEMRNNGLAFMARHGHDINAACVALRAKQKLSPQPVVNREVLQSSLKNMSA